MCTCSPARTLTHAYAENANPNPQAEDNNSATGTRTRVAWVRAEYHNQLDYNGHGHAAKQQANAQLSNPNQQHKPAAPQQTTSHVFAGKRTRVTSIATTCSTTRLLMLATNPLPSVWKWGNANRTTARQTPNTCTHAHARTHTHTH